MQKSEILDYVPPDLISRIMELIAESGISIDAAKTVPECLRVDIQAAVWKLNQETRFTLPTS